MNNNRAQETLEDEKVTNLNNTRIQLNGDCVRDIKSGKTDLSPPDDAINYSSDNVRCFIRQATHHTTRLQPSRGHTVQGPKYYIQASTFPCHQKW